MTERRHHRSGIIGGTAVLVLCVAVAQAASMITAVDPHTLPVTSKLADRLRAHVLFLAAPELQGRKPGTEGNRKAADHLAVRFHEAGLKPLPSLGGYRQALDGNLGDNVIGWRPASGQTGSAPWILLAAHFDHLGGDYLGADDNASAVAILIETARAIPSLPHHHLLVAAFNAEEPPYIRTPLMGSQQFVDRLPNDIASASGFQAVIVMDLMGGAHWLPLRDTIFAAGAEQAPGLYARLKQAGRLEAGGPNPAPLTVRPLGLHLIEEWPLVGHISFSDYDAFRNIGVPFLFLSSGRTPRYHQTTDLPDTLHYERMAATVGWLQHLVRGIDQDTAPYGYEKNRMELADDIATLLPLAAQAAQEESEIPGTSFLSRSRMGTDEQWLRALDAGKTTTNDLKRLERLSLRMQCLLANLPICFLL